MPRAPCQLCYIVARNTSAFMRAATTYVASWVVAGSDSVFDGHPIGPGGERDAGPRSDVVDMRSLPSGGAVFAEVGCVAGGVRSLQYGQRGKITVHGRSRPRRGSHTRLPDVLSECSPLYPRRLVRIGSGRRSDQPTARTRSQAAWTSARYLLGLRRASESRPAYSAEYSATVRILIIGSTQAICRAGAVPAERYASSSSSEPTSGPA